MSSPRQQAGSQRGTSGGGWYRRLGEDRCVRLRCLGLSCGRLDSSFDSCQLSTSPNARLLEAAWSERRPSAIDGIASKKIAIQLISCSAIEQADASTADEPINDHAAVGFLMALDPLRNRERHFIEVEE